MYLFNQIVGISKKFQKQKKLGEEDGSEGEESNSNGSDRKSNKIQSFTPSTPPPYRIAKRRKGIPHRAPMGGSFL